MRSHTYTHKGWFGLCPIYLNRIETQFPTVDARHWSLFWLMGLSHWLQAAAIWVYSAFDPEWEPGFMVVVTGELDPPVTVTYAESESL